MGGDRSLGSTPAVSLALSRVRATALGSAFLPLNMDRCASSASGTDNNHDGTSLQVASCSLQNPALQLPVAYQGLEQDAAATTAAMGGEPAVSSSVADKRSMCSESALCMSCGGPVGASQYGDICDECRDMFVALPSEREQQSLQQQLPQPQQPQLGEDGSDDGGGVSRQKQQAGGDGKPVQGTKGMTKRILGGIPGLRGWRKCQGDASLQSDVVRHHKRADMNTRLAGLRVWHLLFWMIKGSRAHFADLYGGERGVAHGLALSGALVTSVELVDRPATTHHVNVENVQGDALKHDLSRYDTVFASPPCQPFSTMKHAAGADVVSKEEDLLEATRLSCLAAGVPYVLENVVGARKHMKAPIGVCGTMFGLPTARHRLLESNLDLLSRHCLECDHDGQCLGARSRLKRIDKQGNKYWCCRGNLFGIYGTACRAYGTVKQWADAMGALWMTGKGLALSLPPVYGQYAAALVLSCLCEKALRERGLHAVADQLAAVELFDLQVDSPVWSEVRAAVEEHHCLQSQHPQQASPQQQQQLPVWCAPVSWQSTPLNPHAPEYVPPHPLRPEATLHDAAVVRSDGGWVLPAGPWGLAAGSDSYELSSYDLSSLHYSRVGPFSDQIGGNSLSPGVSRYGPARPDMLRCGLQSTLVYLHLTNPCVTLARVEHRLQSQQCLNYTVVVPSCTHEKREVVSWLQSHGFQEGDASWYTAMSGERGWDGSDVPSRHRLQFWHLRQMPVISSTATVQDITLPTEEKVASTEKKVREAAKWNPICLNLEAFLSRPFSTEVLDLVRSVKVPFRGDRNLREEIPQYPWKEASHRVLAIREMERMISCGALEPALEHEVCKISCWVVVVKGGKTRCCLDLSKLVNPHVPSVPFSLPRFHSIGRFAKEGTWLMCYDLRDFFFSLTIAEEDRELFGVRHPWTGRLYRCARVPFGYIEAPHVCCAVSEGVAQILRDMGIDCEVFVDDFCLGGFASPEEAERAGEVFEKLMFELGFQWAPHKKIGPSQQVIFLGIEIDTRPGHACYRLPVQKLAVVLADLDKFLSWKLEGVVECQASDLASLVGRLSFATAVVPASRVHLRLLYDAISVAFVSTRSGAPWVRWGSRPVQFTSDMWEDVAWWRRYLVLRNHWPLDPRSHLRGVVNAGSDASPKWGGGFVSMPAGSEELVIEWDAYEQEQHINWQELVTVVWILNWYAEALQRLLILFAVDNMVTKYVLSRGGAKALKLREPARRAIDLSLHFQWELVPNHVAGRRHVRCDGLSRGEKPKVPGVRLHLRWFEWIQSQMTSPFQVVVGQEDSYVGYQSLMNSSRAASITSTMSFIHPRHDSVATCLWWIFAAVAADPLRTTGVVVLPWRPDAVWWPMTAKLRLLTVLPRSCVGVLEMRGIRGWSAMHARHDLCLFMFPVVALRPILYDWDQHQKLGADALPGGDLPVRRWIYVIHTPEQHAMRSAEEPRAFLTGDLYDAVEWHEWGVVVEHWSKATPYRGDPRHRSFMLRTASGRPMTNKSARKFWQLQFEDRDLEHAFDVTAWVKLDEDNRFKVSFDHMVFVHTVRQVTDFHTIMKLAWRGNWNHPVFGDASPLGAYTSAQMMGEEMTLPSAPALEDEQGVQQTAGSDEDSVSAAQAVPPSSGATHPMDVSGGPQAYPRTLTIASIQHPSNESLIGSSTGYACSLCGGHICFGDMITGGGDTRGGYCHRACLFRVPVHQGSSRMPAVLMRELARRNLNLVWVLPSGHSIFHAVARYYELRQWVFPLPSDDAVRPEVALMAEVRDRLELSPAVNLRVGDLLEITTANRVPQVEKIVKCIIRILARPVRILSLVNPSSVTPTGAYVTEYHPIRGMTQEEIEREMVWLVSHEQTWHTAVSESVEEGFKSEVNPLEYQGQVNRDPVRYSLDLHPLLDASTFESELAVSTPPTPMPYHRQVPRKARPPGLHTWLLARQLQEWEVTQDARRLLRAMSVLVCGSDEKWELLGDIGLGRLRHSPELLVHHGSAHAFDHLSWSHYAMGTSLSVELGCTINFVTMIDQEVGIATFVPRYNIVCDDPAHLSTIMRGRSVYITCYRGCCYPVVNMPQHLEAAAGEPWFPPGNDDGDTFVMPSPAGGVACAVCNDTIPAGVFAVVQDGLEGGLVLTHTSCYSAGKAPPIGAYDGAPRGSVKFARFAAASCFCCEKPIQVNDKIQLKAFSALSGGERWVHVDCEPIREPAAGVGLEEPVLPSPPIQGGIHKPQRMVRAAAQHGDARLNAAFRCLTNNCGVHGAKDISCSCCPRKVHSHCLETQNPFGCEFKCPWCYAAEVTAVTDDVSPELLRDMALLSIDDLDGQRDSEERPILNLKAAADRYAVDRKLSGGYMQVLSTPSLFAAMLRFVSEVEGHPKSVATHVSALKSLMGTWPEADRWAVDSNRQTAKVRGEVRSLTVTPTDPIGGVTGDIVHRAIHKAKQIKNKFESSMAVLANLLAYLAAFRAGEACETEEAHSLHWQGLWWQALWADLKLDDHKFKVMGALISIIGQTATGFKFVEAVEQVCKVWGIQVLEGVVHKHNSEAGEKVNVADAWVVRFALRGVSTESTVGAAALAALDATIDAMQVKFGWDTTLSKWYRRQARSRITAAKASRYVNVAGGTYGQCRLLRDECTSVFRAAFSRQLQAAGVSLAEAEIEAYLASFTVEPMPVLRHTYFGRPTFMPMKAHLYAKLTEGLWNAAADELWPGGHSLRLTTQSGRHGGCADSRRAGREAGLPDDVLRKIINAHFRWRDEHDKMMVYYMGLAKRDERLIPTKNL